MELPERSAQTDVLLFYRTVSTRTAPVRGRRNHGDTSQKHSVNHRAVQCVWFPPIGVRMAESPSAMGRTAL